MRLRADQLQGHLAKSSLAPVYLISGDEPLQVLECADAIRQHAHRNDFAERIVFDATSGFDWNSLIEESAALSLFASKRLLDVRLGSGKPGKEGGAVLTEYAAKPPVDTVLLITSDKIDKQSQQSKWYTALDKAGVTIQVWPIAAPELPGWIQQRGRQLGKQITAEASGLIAQRIEGNLLAARQEIEKLCLLVDKNQITAEDVQAAVTDSTRFDVFEMIRAALTGNTARAIRMLRGLESEDAEPMAVLGALMWDFRPICSLAWLKENGTSLEQAFAMQKTWDNKKPVIKMALQRHRASDLHELLRFAIRTERKLKSADRILGWDMLEEFLLALSSHPLNKQTFTV